MELLAPGIGDLIHENILPFHQKRSLMLDADACSPVYDLHIK